MSAPTNNAAEEVGMGVQDIDIDATQPLHGVPMDGTATQSQSQNQSQRTALTPIITTATTDSQRDPSPIPTEPEDPYPECISDQLAIQGIKVRDFGFPTTTTTSNSNSTHDCELTPEIFNQYKALGEFEFRLGQQPRTLPIPGKNLRRLIEIGWLSEEEVKERCSEEDLKGLEEFDERNRIKKLVLSSQEGYDQGNNLGGYRPDGSYPYLTLRYTHIPTQSERERLANDERLLCFTIDRVMRMAMAMERERERDRIEGEEARRAVREIEEERRQKAKDAEEKERLAREREEAGKSVGAWVAASGSHPAAGLATPSLTVRPSRSRKRSPHQAWPDEDADGIAEDDDSETKRLRLARSHSATSYYQQQQPSSQSQSGSKTHNRTSSQPQPPEKQYPAPLSAYDPVLYPDAASVIESQSQSRGRPPYHLQREETPPANDVQSQQQQEETEDTRPNALKRSPKNGLKRTLTRGRTLVQIC